MSLFAGHIFSPFSPVCICAIYEHEHILILTFIKALSFCRSHDASHSSHHIQNRRVFLALVEQSRPSSCSQLPLGRVLQILHLMSICPAFKGSRKPFAYTRKNRIICFTDVHSTFHLLRKPILQINS